MIITRCKVESCKGAGKLQNGGKRCFIKGLCNSHYQRLSTHGDLNIVYPLQIKNNHTFHPLYRTYQNMISRCNNPNVHNYKNYGARGIAVCDRWLGKDGFQRFCEDMGEKPSPKHTLDRIDNSNGYSKENCRWSSWHEQAANRRNNVGIVGVSYMNNGKRKPWLAHLSIGGVSYSKKFKLKEDAIAHRLKLERIHL